MLNKNWGFVIASFLIIAALLINAKEGLSSTGWTITQGVLLLLAVLTYVFMRRA